MNNHGCFVSLVCGLGLGDVWSPALFHQRPPGRTSGQ